MLVFDLDASRSLWVPCVELFSRCYGRSQEVKRVLATYAWPEAQARLLPPPEQPTTPARPVVKVLPPIVEGDAVFLTLRHSADAERVAREIYSQLDTAAPVGQSPGVVFKIGPWFQGPAQLLVEGEWLADGAAFLVHRIVGCSDPPGPPIVVVRERDESHGSSPDSPHLAPGPPRSRWHLASDPTGLTADEPPGRDAGHVEIRDADLTVLGPPRSVTLQYIPRPARAQRRSRQSPEPSRYSTGDATGLDPDVGQARLHALTDHGCDGDLLGMWEALRGRVRPGSSLDSVDWYTFGRRFQSVGPPELFRFRPYAGRRGARRRWVWLDPHPGPQRALRGMLVLRCVLNGRTGYVVDLDRRSDESGSPTESFSGLVSTLPLEAQLDDWLRLLLSRLRDERGVFGSLLDQCPGQADDLRHPAADSMLRSAAAARNALSKLRDLLFAQSS